MKASLKDQLLKARQNHYAIGAFNFDNLEMLKAIVEAAEESNSPIIAMITESAAKYIGKEIVIASANAIISNTKVPIVLHWDHGYDLNLIKWACDNEFSSVMLDASLDDFNTNVNKTLEIVNYAKSKNVEVESEIGHVGGKEDDIDSNINKYTSVDEAIKFVNLTQIDALAIAVGTSHGIFKTAPNLNFDRIKEIRDSINTPLVLHGSSGLSDTDLKKAINSGICKINIGTDLKLVYANSLKQWFKENPISYDARKFGRFAIDQMKKVIKQKLEILGSINKA
ncbi:class II fructose-bisphosphate aldolase family protein [Mycoplasma capricolum subsp. capripneumoniae]|uniref:Fructose-bisphosphate aldolase n=1 Tax=Mycoplasma capricolum subsp. capripneumoniae 87001 TaxID=1124992 RepID=A0A9N7ASW8_MYCCC|nr:class II fructose-bisphosphate aldolase [Mycoplasma capricolum]AJK51648.1 fructose-bisphosphate aldolase [Mycoplasma capricolum subsp. capripneumoniae 87001]AQU77624.1 fructose-bisphosphate aldolase [Mycoplasma capricolum subsp. capripneumoniae]KEY84649.1 Fructose-bisphosphate aldolase class-II [Mycoplasma capricolum subsp. capripneumoniae 99108]QDL19745.1 ketose-bisphosphate aldolase [Mycoplasma capricolum subsp. capripneumoniae]QDL20430.1 ketose-bisphosphate aldolase [Mycoplasma capricolu